MSIEIKGLNNLIQRFTELENIDITKYPHGSFKDLQ